MSRLAAIALVGVILLFGACSEDPLDEPPAAAPTGEVGECGSITQPILTVLASRILVGQATLNVHSIEATTAEGTWFVAGEIEGDGYEGNDDVGLWATTADPEGDDAGLEFTAVNELAVGGSDWEEDPELSEDDPAVATLYECVADREEESQV